MASPPSGAGWGWRRSAAGCRGAADGGRPGPMSPSSTSTPRCITAARGQSLRTTLRLWEMNSMDMPDSRFSFFKRSRIWAWMVTSRAVVGSSSSSSLGRDTMAAAIMARCSMPPESSWGYFRYTASGSGSSAAARAASARSVRASRSRSVWMRRTSSTWRPTVISGSMALIGSWNTTPMSFPWTFRSSARSAWSSSAPSSRICPEKLHCFRGSSPATAMAVTDLPEPDSPTRPRISPSRMVRDTPETASRWRVWNFTCRSRISSITPPPRPGAAGPRP